MLYDCTISTSNNHSWVFNFSICYLRLRPTEEEEQEAKGDETTWYHEGPDELKAAREWLVRYSLPRAKARFVYCIRPLSIFVAHLLGCNTLII